MKKYQLIFTLLLTFINLLTIGQTKDQSGQFENHLVRLYGDIMPVENIKPAFDLYRRAMIGYYDLLANGTRIDNHKITLIDFRKSSNKKRLWVIDLKTNQILYYRLVAHGSNTGEEYAQSFSNKKNSNQSSLGFYLTAETYIGKHGLSLRLDGQEEGFNDMARERAVVMHSANYVSREFAKTYGRMGRSFGCPAIATKDHKVIIQNLANRSVIFIYYPDANYESKTLLNNIDAANTFYLNNVLNAQGAVDFSNKANRNFALRP